MPEADLDTAIDDALLWAWRRMIWAKRLGVPLAQLPLDVGYVLLPDEDGVLDPDAQTAAVKELMRCS